MSNNLLDPKQQLPPASFACVIHLGPDADETLVNQGRFEAFVYAYTDKIKSLKARLSVLEGQNPPTPPPPPVTTEVKWGWFAANPYTGLQTADTLTYQGQTTHAPGAGVEVDLHSVPEEHYVVVREAATEPAKTRWSDTGSPFNNGYLPDSVFYAPFVQGTYRYYVSRVPVSFDVRTTSRVLFTT
jgi:hypothetical protein